MSKYYHILLNTTKHDYLQKLYQYGITKNKIEKEIINLRQINAKSNFSTVTQYIPETRGTCLTHGHNNFTLSIHAIYGFTSFIECSKIACNEKQICNLDDDLNILDDDDETETCLSICAKRYMRCIHFNQDEYTNMAIYGAAVGEDIFLGYNKPMLLLTSNIRINDNKTTVLLSSVKLEYSPYGIITTHELIFGLLFSCFTIILFICIIKFNFQCTTK